jgi:hypothetical protein
LLLKIDSYAKISSQAQCQPLSREAIGFLSRLAYERVVICRMRPSNGCKMQAHASRHAQQDLSVHGFDGAFVMTMFTAPVSPKAFSKRKNVSCSLKDC